MHHGNQIQECKVVDAFSFLWTDNFYYALPPFSLLGRMVQKIRRDQSMCLVIAPIWPTESWYTDLLQILIDNPIILPTQRTLLTIKSTNKVHPLWDKMRLMACVVSGNLMKVETFLQKQPVSLWHHGELGQYSTYKWTCYCRKRQINYIQSTLNEDLDFFTSLYENSLSYSAINSARSALSAFGIVHDGVTFGSHPIVIRFMKCIYNLRPPIPRYIHTWNVSIVLKELRHLSPVK